MAFIQVCPQYARSVRYYALKTPAACKTDELTLIPLEQYLDGKEKNETFDGKIPFDRLGDYLITVTLTSESKNKVTFVSSFDMHNNVWYMDVKGHEFFAPPIARQNQYRMHVFKPLQQSSGFYIRLNESTTITELTLMIEYLS